MKEQTDVFSESLFLIGDRYCMGKQTPIGPFHMDI